MISCMYTMYFYCIHLQLPSLAPLPLLLPRSFFSQLSPFYFHVFFVWEVTQRVSLGFATGS